MEMEMEIETSDQHLLNDLIENPPSSIPSGQKIPLTNEATLALKSHVKRRGINIPPESITLILTLGTSIATNIVSSWLYEKLKGRTLNLHINRIETPVEDNAIQTIIDETIKKQ